MEELLILLLYGPYILGPPLLKHHLGKQGGVNHKENIVGKSVLIYQQKE